MRFYQRTNVLQICFANFQGYYGIAQKSTAIFLKQEKKGKTTVWQTKEKVQKGLWYSYHLKI